MTLANAQWERGKWSRGWNVLSLDEAMSVLTEIDLQLEDGGRLHVYDSGTPRPGEQVAILWHHGTPNIGLPPEPLFPASEARNIRWVSYDRPGYGDSSPDPGRNLASVAAYASRVADALGIRRFAAMGHSGGGSHALACGALLADRVCCVVSVAGLAPLAGEGLEWFDGMFRSGADKLRAAARGRATFEEHVRCSTYDPEMFTPADHAALMGTWNWFHAVVGPAQKSGARGAMDDELAYAAPWGFDPRDVTVPTLLLHGEQDRIAPSAHALWLARHCPNAELRLHPDDGHISVLRHAPAALDWICMHAERD
jgi:pimeloyl-ACP methyl ester carboxylesterase